VGEPIRKGFALLSNELIREAAHDDALGFDGFAVVAFLVSWATPDGKKGRPWETSAAQMSDEFGWGRNRRRITKAIEAAVKEKRLVVRQYVRDGLPVPRRCAYAVAPGGRRFSDAELHMLERPIDLPSKASSGDGDL
jgi:hypothetical protein